MKKDFESRFMPNVKFKVKSYLGQFLIENDIKHLVIPEFTSFYTFEFGESRNTVLFEFSSFAVVNDQLINLHDDDSSYAKCNFPEVSIYEAIPELVPDGMKYDKELNQLLSNDVLYIISDRQDFKHKTYGDIKEEFLQKENNSCKNEKSKHYEIWKDFEAIDVLKNCLTRAEFIGFLKGNILKYQLRLGKKDHVSKEIEKIKDYQNELNYILKELNVK